MPAAIDLYPELCMAFKAKQYYDLGNYKFESGSEKTMNNNRELHMSLHTISLSLSLSLRVNGVFSTSTDNKGRLFLQTQRAIDLQSIQFRPRVFDSKSILNTHSLNQGVGCWYGPK